MLQVEEIVPLDDRPAAWAPRPRRTAAREPASLSRRHVLGSALGVGAGIGLWAVGLLPPARRNRAEAACVGSFHSDMAGFCPEASQVDPDCSPGCGPSYTQAEACNADGWHQWTGWYRNRPNACTGGWADGWTWSAQCSCSSGCIRRMRCHDGCTLQSDNSWKNTICKHYTTGCLC